MVATENTELREQIKKMEYEKVEMRHNLIALKEAHDPKAALNAGDMDNPDMKKLLRVNEANEALEKRLRMLQQREKELIDSLIMRGNINLPQYSNLAMQGPVLQNTIPNEEA